MPKVSVIIPVYNVGKYLRKCLDSVINQTLKDIEIICVNDGSTDNSGKILDEYAAKDKRIKVIHQENQGLGAARNVGIDLAKGEYIGFVDSDDWISTGFYEKLYETAKRENSDISACNIMRVKNNQTYPLLKYTTINKATTLKNKFKLLHMPAYNYVVNKIYRTDFLKINNLYFETNIYFEDMRWSPIVVLKSKHVINTIGADYFYFYNESSIGGTRRFGGKKQQDFLDSSKWLDNFMERHNLQKEIVYYKLFDFIPLLKIEEK